MVSVTLPENLRRISRFGWAILILIAAIDTVWIVAGGFHLRSLLSFPTALIPLPAMVAWYFRSMRPNARYFVLFDSLAQLMSFGFLGIFTYLVFSTSLPLVDAKLSALDYAIGVDWPALIGWIQSHPGVDRALFYVYDLSVAQTLLIYFLLCYRQPERSQELIVLMMLSMVITSVIAGLAPSTTAYMFYGPSHPELRVEIPMDRDLLPLRDGSLRVLDLMTMEGMVDFPSYHTAMAVIFIYVFRGRPFLFWLSLVFNLIVIVSTLSAGAHYFIDLPAGALVVVIAVWIYKSVIAKPSGVPLAAVRVGS